MDVKRLAGVAAIAAGIGLSALTSGVGLSTPPHRIHPHHASTADRVRGGPGAARRKSPGYPGIGSRAIRTITPGWGRPQERNTGRVRSTQPAQRAADAQRRSLRRHEQIRRGAVVDLLRRCAAVAGHQLVRRCHSHLPAVTAPPIADVFALLEVPQLVGSRDLALRVRLGHRSPGPGPCRSRRCAAASGSAKLGDSASMPTRLPGAVSPACARTAAPGPSPAGTSAAPRPTMRSAPTRQNRPAATPRPVLTQVHRDADPMAGRFCAVLVQGRGFEVQHPGLVELEDRHPVGPGQPPGPASRPAARITT